MSDPSWIQTYTGRKFYPFDPDPDEICIEDIAHSLAMQCRYNGHTKQFYSVAQHSVLLSQKFFSSNDMRLAALLHDASEAYLSDVPRPIKHRPEFRFYREAEERLQRVIIRKFGVELNEAAWRLIKTYDGEMLSIEAPQLMAPLHTDWTHFQITDKHFEIEPWSPDGAKIVFLSTFNHTVEQMNKEKTNA